MAITEPLIAPRPRGRPADPELPGRRREQILSAATAFFAAAGYAEADLAALANKLEVGKGTLYRYFPTKEALFFAALDRGMERLHAAVDGAMTGITDDLAGLDAGITAYLGFFAENPDLIELMILERAAFKGRAAPVYFAHKERYRAERRNRYRRLMKSGQVRTMDPDAMSAFIGNLLYGTVLTHHFTGRAASLRDQTKILLDVIQHGLLTDSERGKRPALASLKLESI
jgi:AcrR family transcriptional regulator